MKNKPNTELLPVLEEEESYLSIKAKDAKMIIQIGDLNDPRIVRELWSVKLERKGWVTILQFIKFDQNLTDLNCMVALLQKSEELLSDSDTNNSQDQIAEVSVDILPD